MSSAKHMFGFRTRHTRATLSCCSTFSLGIMAVSNKRANVPRHPNFKAEDLELLAESANTRMGELFGKFSNVVTRQSKSLIWDRIAKKNLIATTALCNAPGKEFKRKWTDWASSTKAKNARRKVACRIQRIWS